MIRHNQPPHRPHHPSRPPQSPQPLARDFGPMPYATNIDQLTVHNDTYRTAIWTGKYLQATVMSINVNDDIGLEVHPDTDQFLRIEEGSGIVQMGNSRDNLNYQQHVFKDWAIFVPAGTWHNITNTGHVPMKLYTIYAPPHHPWGTVHQTKAVAEAEEG